MKLEGNSTTALALTLCLGLWGAAAAVEGAPGRWRVAGTAPLDYKVEIEPEGGIERTSCARLRSVAEEPSGFVALIRESEASLYAGRRLRLSAWARAEAVEGWAGLFLRIENSSGEVVAFDNMSTRPIRGTLPWQAYEVVLDVPADARKITYGAVFDGTGTVRVDEFDFDLVGEEVPATGLHRPLTEPRNLDFEEPVGDGSRRR